MHGNLKAFLDMLARSEGTSTVKGSDNGYNVLVGGALFQGYADHPRKLVNLGRGLQSTAAGRYQLLARYFDAYKLKLKVPDFGPASQDAIACQQIRERNAMGAIVGGDIKLAISLCSNIWASLPGNQYGQRTNKISDLLSWYQSAGGVLANGQV